MNDQTIIRVSKQDNPFVMIDRRTLEDVRLSLKAKGLLAYLLSRPDDWKVNMKHIIKQSNDGRDAHYNTMTELISMGYVERIEHRDPTTKKVTGYEYVVYEYPLPEKPDTGKPDTENPYINNNELTNISNNSAKPPENIFTLYMNNISSAIPPLLVDELKDYEEKVPDHKINEAFKIAVDSNVRKWRYVKAIFDNWIEKGWDWTPEQEISKRTLQANNIRRMKHGYTIDTRTDEEIEAQRAKIREALSQQ